MGPNSESAWKWMVGAGIASALLVAFLIGIDAYLARVDFEHKRGVTLHEMRVGQTSLPSAATDERQLQPFLEGHHK